MYKLHETIKRRLGPLAAALCLTLAVSPAFTTAARAAEGDAMSKLVSWGVVNGYAGGQLYPERNLTRAEFVAMVNRAYGYKELREMPFNDVPENAWFYDDIGIAYSTGYFGGTGPSTASPNASLTREQTLTLLGRNMRLQQLPGEVTEYSDGRSFSNWSRGYARAAYQAGLTDGGAAFRPKDSITRGEMAELLQRALGTLINAPGVYTPGSVYGNVTVNTPNVTLRDATVSGNLYISGGLGLGDVTLENVRVLGDIIVAGGGESASGSESVVLRNVTADNLVVDSISDRLVSLRAEGNTDIANTALRSDAFVQDRTRVGQGLRNISLESPDADASFTLSGNVEKVVNKTPGSTLGIGAGTVQSLTVGGSATDTKLALASTATVKTLNLDAAADVTGGGDIGTLNVGTSGSKTDMLPDTIAIRAGATADIAGTEMNTAQGQTSSLEPRLLAGYPKLTSLASATATAVFSTNKPGTVYWAISYELDGAIPESELITPISDNQKNIRNGNVKIASAETETSVALSGLTPGISYRLTAVMTDDRGVHSPVKSFSFTTSDNTVPAFNGGYPAVSQLTDSYAQVAVMPNKSCTLYYALFHKGVTAPTAVQLRAGGSALIGALRSGSMSVTKNTLDFPEFSGLTGGTDYTLYICLSDNTRTSAVTTLNFTTEEDLPPEFNILPVVTDRSETSLTLTANIDEIGTLYWAAVVAGDDFPRDLSASFLGSFTDPEARDARALENHILQIVSGSGALQHGQASMRGDQDQTFTISGLSAGVSYDVWYVARDTAGNYSAFSKASPDRFCRLTASTAGSAAAPLSTSGEASSASTPGAAPAAPLQTPAGASPQAPVQAVPAPAAPEPALTLSAESLALRSGETETLIPTVENLEGDYSVVWTTSDRGTAFVDLSGNVTAVGPGSAAVKATIRQNGEDVLTATCSVTVNE